MMLLYRVVRAKYADRPLDVEGSRLYGGRWSPPGVGILCAAEHPALALVEILVHAPRVPYDQLPHYRLFTIGLPDETPDAPVRRILASGELPPYWQEPTYERSQRVLGSWLTQPDVVALGVPSAVLPVGVNYLLHAAHRDYGRLRVVREEPLLIDSHLWQGKG